MMARILVSCLLAMLLVSAAQAATRCRTDSVGTTTCRDDQGRVWV